MEVLPIFERKLASGLDLLSFDLLALPASALFADAIKWRRGGADSFKRILVFGKKFD